MVLGLDLARELGAWESGLAAAITIRANGRPRVSVVNAGVLAHPVTGGPINGRRSSQPAAHPAKRPRVPPLTTSTRDPRHEGITVIDYRPLQQAWNTEPRVP